MEYSDFNAGAAAFVPGGGAAYAEPVADSYGSAGFVPQQHVPQQEGMMGGYGMPEPVVEEAAPGERMVQVIRGGCIHFVP